MWSTSLGSKLATEDARISGLEKEAQQLGKQVKQLEAALGEREWNEAEDGKNPYADGYDREYLERTLQQVRAASTAKDTLLAAAINRSTEDKRAARIAKASNSRYVGALVLLIFTCLVFFVFQRCSVSQRIAGIHHAALHRTTLVAYLRHNNHIPQQDFYPLQSD